jgi:hypothetical protein
MGFKLGRVKGRNEFTSEQARAAQRKSVEAQRARRLRAATDVSLPRPPEPPTSPEEGAGAA